MSIPRNIKQLPHQYKVTATVGEEGHAALSSRGLTPLISAPPAEFGGPGDLWSPETLLVASVVDCFVMTFKAIAANTRLKWSKIVCDAKGTLDRAEGAVRFTGILLDARLEVPAETNLAGARLVLEKAEKACLVGNSLNFKPTLQYEVAFEEVPQLLPT
jgi:organic hydroperoxide reductase OsmC/OhrA